MADSRGMYGEQRETSGKKRRPPWMCSASWPVVDDASGLPVDADAPQRRRSVVPFSDAVNNVLKRFGVDAHVQDTALLDAMLRAWPEVAGPDLAARLKPEKFDKGFLYVLARNNAELFEIRQFKLRGLEARAKKHPAFAGLRQIRVRCGIIGQ